MNWSEQYCTDRIEHLLAISGRPLRAVAHEYPDGDGFEIVIEGEIVPDRRLYSGTTLEEGVTLTLGFETVQVIIEEKKTILLVE